MAAYPINEARNLARNVSPSAARRYGKVNIIFQLSTSNYIVIADMDHLFSKNFEAKMLSLAKRQLTKNPKTVLVYRIFEVHESVKDFPKTKKDLYRLFNESKAQEFHKYYGAHNIPRLNPWFESPENLKNDTKIQFYRL